MNDLISRKAMREAMYHEAMEKDSDEQKWDSGCWIRYKMFERVIESIPSEPQWIPCSERLPEEEKKTYWVCTDAEYQYECRWTNNRFGIGEGEWGWSIFDTPQYTKPIAWMPLPEPYKGDE